MNKNKLRKIKEKLNNLPRSSITIAFILIMVLAYLRLAYSYLYIPGQLLTIYGSSPGQILTIFTYSFMHLSPQHLIANIGLLLPMGIIAEKKLKTYDYLSIFFASAITSGLVFHLLTPDPILLVGGSSAVAGIMAAAIFIDIKKALIAVLIFGAFIHVATPMVEQHVRQELGVLEQEVTRTEEEYNETEQRINQTEREIQNHTEEKETLEYECHVQNITEACEELEEKEKEMKEKQEEKEMLEEQRNKTIERLLEIIREKEVVEHGVEREDEATTSTIVHLVGAMTGIAYLALFRRDILWNLPSQVSQ